MFAEQYVPKEHFLDESSFSVIAEFSEPALYGTERGTR